MKRYVLGVLILGLFFVIVRCGTRVTPSSGASPSSPLMPRLLQASNGQTLGFYTAAGAYGFKTQASSILSFGTGSTVTPLDQYTGSGILFFGTSTCTTNCNNVYYVSASTGHFAFGSVGGSGLPLTPGGLSPGGTVNSVLKYLYVADPISQRVTFLKAATLGYVLGTMAQSSFAAPAGHTSQYVGVDPMENLLVVTDSMAGSVYFLNAVNGGLITTSSGQTTSLLGVSAGCTTAAQVGKVKMNTSSHFAYVLCGQTVTYFTLVSSPVPANGSVMNSMFTTVGITAPADMIYASNEATVFITGGSIVLGLDGTTGATKFSVDLSTYNCGTSLDLQGLAYDSATDTLFVADHTNSTIYVLNASDQTLKNGTCANSTFSTDTDVPQPTSLGFF